jgi:hypothetical protein
MHSPASTSFPASSVRGVISGLLATAAPTALPLLLLLLPACAEAEAAVQEGLVGREPEGLTTGGKLRAARVSWMCFLTSLPPAGQENRTCKKVTSALWGACAQAAWLLKGLSGNALTKTFLL